MEIKNEPIYLMITSPNTTSEQRSTGECYEEFVLKKESHVLTIMDKPSH